MSDDAKDDFHPRPKADSIPCPFLTTAYNAGHLNPDSEGTLDAPAIERALAWYGISPRMRERVSKAVVKMDGDDSDTTLNLFELEGSGLDHTGSTGLRDPKVDPSKLPVLLAFGEGGRMYRRHFAKAASHFADVEPGLKGTVQENMDMAALLEVFGRTDADGEKYLTDADVKRVWIEGRHPEGWTQPPADSIGGSILAESGKMCVERLVQRFRDLF